MKTITLILLAFAISCCTPKEAPKIVEEVACIETPPPKTTDLGVDGEFSVPVMLDMCQDFETDAGTMEGCIYIGVDLERNLVCKLAVLRPECTDAWEIVQELTICVEAPSTYDDTL